MNTIATTYHHALPSGGSESGLWGSVRAVMRRLTPARAPAASNPTHEAAAVRAMADAIRVSDPHFAADLYAAADRHEALFAAESDR